MPDTRGNFCPAFLSGAFVIYGGFDLLYWFIIKAPWGFSL
ncbi:hypothetical protein HAL013_08950 [Helicobacter ailurogastricus]|uniref:Uncharacterized protein n=1 Tax=Helicobacter ailurogastricus TaxID=1578720 RepID=A0A0K2X3X2_9HELI|nr:hypothetical protein HAL011_03280 [Helicobacter ailurogastricus]CRF42698.1 hypothetical protein HAL013_08950 [Helicobacter ailurogastricus]